jgi:hypothetical protein
METIENKLPVITTGLTKSQIAELAKFGVDYVLESGNPELVAEQISVMESYIKAVKADERFADYVREELLKNGGKLTTASGAKIEVMEGGTKYHFEKCDDPELELLEQALLSAKGAVEARQKFLKNVPVEGIEVAIPYTGEVCRVYPPYKTSTSTYKVTLSK